MSRAAIFGKLPTHGDFVSRGIDAGERDRLDAWLSWSLADARARCGTAFDDLYDAAPAWRFVEDGRAGALAASMDRAGRRFPLWLAIEGVSAARCEALLHRALAEGWDADALLTQAEGSPPDAAAPPGEGWWIEDAGGAIVARAAGARPAGLLHTMLTVREGVHGR